jgi:uncharacterized membrane protein YeaQ/YmgE (transglycosylase-associated protein family)
MGVIWLNTGQWGNAFLHNASRGFPFTVESWSDVILPPQLNLWAFFANAIGAALLFCVFRYWPAVPLSRTQSATLLALSAGYLWANSVLWVGLKQAIVNASLRDDGAETVGYGFPFPYYELGGNSSLEYQWGFVANLIVGVIGVAVVQRLYSRRNNQQAAQPAAGADH